MKYIFYYTDGSVRNVEFENTKEADDFAFLEGDHLVDYRQFHETSKENKDGVQS